MLSRAALGLGGRMVPIMLATTRSALQPRTSMQQQLFRGLRDVRGRTTQTKRIIDVKPIVEVTQTLKRKIGPMQVGQLVASGGAVVGLGALCFYGLGLGNEPGAIDKMAVWPSYVRTRIRDTYMYFGATAGVVAASAITVFRSPAGQKFLAVCQRHPIMSTVGLIVAVIGSSQAMLSVPYSPGFGSKQLLWLVNGGVLGLMVAPIGIFGGAIALRAAWYTAGIVGGLSTVAVCAPSEKFLNWAGPLSIGLGGMFVVSIGSMFIPPTSALGLSLYSVVLYGGLVLFSAFLLYDTQKIIRKAETHPTPSMWMVQQGYDLRPYDPINASHGIFMATLHIFIRMAQILAMGGGRK